MINRIKRHKIKIVAAALLALVGILIWSLFIWENEIFILVQKFSLWLREESATLNSAPLIIFPILLFLLPIFALPVTPVYLIAGAREEPVFLVVALCFAGVTANICASYFIARKFSKWIEPRLQKRNFRIPEINADEHYDVTFLVRIIPGNPLAVQNYALGLAGVDFKKYLVVSLPIQFVHVTGFIYFSDGILSGDTSNFMLGASLVCAGAVIGRIVQKRLKKRNGLSKTQ